MFLPNVPGATFIPGATSIPESRVHNGVKSNLIQFLQVLNPLHFVVIFSMFDLEFKN